MMKTRFTARFLINRACLITVDNEFHFFAITSLALPVHAQEFSIKTEDVFLHIFTSK